MHVACGSIYAREERTHYLGDNAYQRYDDFDFQRPYETDWNEEMLISSRGNDRNYVATYAVVAAFLCDMQRRQIDWVAAQVIVTESYDDPVLTAFKALLLCPNALFRSNKLHKDHDEVLGVWERPENLSLLSTESDECGTWAQHLEGVFSDVVGVTTSRQ